MSLIKYYFLMVLRCNEIKIILSNNLVGSPEMHCTISPMSKPLSAFRTTKYKLCSVLILSICPIEVRGHVSVCATEVARHVNRQFVFAEKVVASLDKTPVSN